MYTTLNYLEFYPRDDKEARRLFKEKVAFKLPKEINESVKFINKIRGLIL